MDRLAGQRQASQPTRSARPPASHPDPAPHFRSSLPAAPLLHFPPPTRTATPMPHCGRLGGLSFASSREIPRPTVAGKLGVTLKTQSTSGSSSLHLESLPKTGLRTCKSVTCTDPQRPLAPTFAPLSTRTSLPATGSKTLV
ncbi:hypothetical protein H671_1g1225 [Cricetulus griseus]|nr:hypothetical protein H671_1g1225 [Cricetulus griseus]